MKIRQANKLVKKVSTWEYYGKEYGDPFPLRGDTDRKVHKRYSQWYIRHT